MSTPSCSKFEASLSVGEEAARVIGLVDTKESRICLVSVASQHVLSLHGIVHEDRIIASNRISVDLGRVMGVVR